jgi:hypothetical protein
MDVCNEIIDENEMCLSENGECETEQEASSVDEVDM